ncbi:MAG: hypothetical protein H6735_13685 [Alphaproteobacteria bacterium]|nr:hypothetical protein [Alphaproteobacteria bacterium]
MSDRALEVFATARDRQMNQNFARTIYVKVRAAKTDWEDAGECWPFELLQNAPDAGPRPGRAAVSVEIGRDGLRDAPT